LTIFIFNCFNIAFSAGLQFRYSTSENTNHYALSVVAAIVALVLCLLAILGLTFLDEKGYGEYKLKFKNEAVSRLYIPISIAYRMALGFYLAYGNEYFYASLIILAISIAYLLYNIINLPFADSYQNYRANLCHFTQLTILFVANFYTVLKVNRPME
jgi:hypothetical protein